MLCVFSQAANANCLVGGQLCSPVNMLLCPEEEDERGRLGKYSSDGRNIKCARNLRYFFDGSLPSSNILIRKWQVVLIGLA